MNVFIQSFFPFRDSMVLSDNFLPTPLNTNTATLVGAWSSKPHQLQSLVEPCKVNGHVTTRVGQMKSNIASDLADYSGGECIDECPGKMCTYQRKLSNVNTPGKLSSLNMNIMRKLDQNQRDVNQLASAIKGCWSHAPTKRGGYLIPHSKSYSASD